MIRLALLLAVAFACAATPLRAQPAAPAQPPAATPPAAGAAVPVPVPQPVQPGWEPRAVAELQVLDKVNARVAVLAVKVGQVVRHGAIDIGVQACFTRPPNQAPDSAAFLEISDPQRGGVRFRGWMFAANPTVAMLEHPIYDVRVLNCRP